MDKQYLLTERAHLMCPNMHFGILFSINKKYDIKRIKNVIKSLSEAYPFLKSLIAKDDNGNFYYSLQEQLEIGYCEMHSLNSLEDDYRNINESGWDVRSEGLLRILTYPGDDGFEILFVAHHLLCDGRGLMELASSFADCYVKGTEPVYTKECLINSLKELPPGSDLPWISKIVIKNANKKWKKENHRVEYREYLEFERNFIKKNRLNMSFETISCEHLTSLKELCHNNDISINDYLVAKMMLDESIDKVVIAADVRKYLPNYKEGSMGNYSTAFSVVCHSKSQNLIETAKKVSRIVHQQIASPQKLMLVLACYLRMTPELIDAVAISTLGEYNSKSGRFVGRNMFGYTDRCGYCITNLGSHESDTIANAVFIPPASPANKKTTGVLTVNGMMNTCTVTA
ncbi:MAG TPA: hypothetical protein PK466_12990 [Thermotogota bacterium]|nr:hypothetical protein [Thermotogota bacterium]